MNSSYKFIQKFWSMSEQIIELTKKTHNKKNENLDVFTNQIINKINQALEKFRYNIIIATYHEIYSFYKKIADHNENYENLKNNFEKIILVMMPVIPHLANECLLKLDYTKTTKWPEIEKKYLNKEEYEIVIQVNGKKKRGYYYR